MFDRKFNVLVYKRKDGKIDEVECQGVYRVIGDYGIEHFEDFIFDYACDGFVVEIEKYNIGEE